MTFPGARSKIVGLIWIGAAAFFAVLVAGGLPWLARHTPWSWETRLSDTIGQFQPAGGECKISPEARKLFDKIVKRIYPLMPKDASFPLSVEVVRGEDVNAFASLGAHVYVFSGLIEQAHSAEELAGVLAHEIEHVRHRHIIESVIMRVILFEGVAVIFGGTTGGMNPELARLFLSLRFGRAQESQADEDGFKRLQAAGVDVRGVRDFFSRLDNETTVPAWLSDHPAGRERARMAEKYASASTGPVLSEAKWKIVRHICR